MIPRTSTVVDHELKGASIDTKSLVVIVRDKEHLDSATSMRGKQQDPGTRQVPLASTGFYPRHTGSRHMLYVSPFGKKGTPLMLVSAIGVKNAAHPQK